MLKRKALNRIFFTTVGIFIVLTIYSLNLINKEEDKVYEINNYETNFSEEIYTLNNDNYISKTLIYVNSELTTLEKVKEVIETMIENNNKNALLPSYFKPILPQNTKIISVEQDEKLIKINFSKELLNINEEQSEKMIEAITYTLTSIDNINGIEIYVENQLLQFIPNTRKKIPTLLTKDFGINKVYEITSTKDINKVVLYFMGEDLNYIPITKYLNDKRKKVEIIVESLANDYNHLTNLVSLVDNKLELIDYKINENVIDLNLNEYFLQENTINEDVVNAISYSIFDNYDIDYIVFYQNNEKIIEKMLNK